MVFGGAFRRVCRRELSRQSAPQCEGSDEKQQQAEKSEQKNENDERRHRNGPGDLRLRLAVFAANLTPHFAQVGRRHGDAQLLRKVAGDEPEAEALPVKLPHQRPPR